jgi:uncharacterized peroxidase-related enzyme
MRILTTYSTDHLKGNLMNRLAITPTENAPAAAQPLLAAVHKQFGMTPNLMKLVSASPAALEGYLALNGALAKGTLDGGLRERIALAIAEFNGCEYCLSAHTYMGKNLAKLNDQEIAAARDGGSADARNDAALRFAVRVAASRGQVSDVELANLRAAGFDDAAVLEIVLNVALNVLTNYVNNVAQTEVDFPKVELKLAA